jgi:5-formaminoimidazole-4-carboxamide-1-beta-D-ribofuranosyl 5'-monophosphate synthetase
MITLEEIVDILGGYDLNNLAVATLGSHSSLNILRVPRRKVFALSAFVSRRMRYCIRSFRLLTS